MEYQYLMLVFMLFIQPTTSAVRLRVSTVETVLLSTEIRHVCVQLSTVDNIVNVSRDTIVFERTLYHESNPR